MDRSRSAILAAALLAMLLLAAHARAQQRIRITGDRLSGIVLPVEPLAGAITLDAQRGWAWTVDDTKRLYLEGDVRIVVAGRLFSASSATVWINRIPSAGGVINQIAMFFEHLRDPARQAGLGVTGRELLVTASTRGDVVLRTALLEPRRAPRSSSLGRAEARLALHLRRIVGGDVELVSRPRYERPPEARSFMPVPGGPMDPQAFDAPRTITLPEEPAARWLQEPGATITYVAERTELVTGPEENVITAIGSIVVDYHAGRGVDELSQLTLSAERAVIFMEPGSVEDMTRWQLSAEKVRGIYLEGNVAVTADRGEYALRAPRVYYDFRTDRAIMLDAVLRTYTRNGRVPLYARAAEMRQIAEDQWQARTVRLSTSEFAVPHLAIGAERTTITHGPPGARTDPPPGGDGEPLPPVDGDHDTYFDARSMTVRTGDLPIFYWPGLKGRMQDIPLRSVSLGTEDNDGVKIETAWDLYSLLGIEGPDGTDAELRLDGYTKRGFGGGVVFTYDVAGAEGAIDLYGQYDDGVDRSSAGVEVEQGNDFRGVGLLEHRLNLTRYLTLDAQASYISDETYISTWREDDYEERREYETSIYVKHQKNRSALTLLGKYDINDFISNSYLLASQAYTVERAPELSYRNLGIDWFRQFTYTGETQLSRMRLSFQESTPREAGVRGRAFGIGDDDPIDDLLRSQGLRQRWVMRADSRHELSLPQQVGIMGVTPFFVGRGTIYDNDFDEFSSDSDSTRLFAAAGLRLNTQVQRVDNSVENRMLGLHRLRHIIEPSMTLWYGYATVDQTDLPVYDLDVESLATGAAMRVGVRNTFQTQRGGPGRWRSVDVLTLNNDLVLTSGDTDRETPVPSFFDYRPEYSQMGPHVRNTMMWLVSDSLSVVGETTLDLDESAVSLASIGTELRHSPVLSTYVEYRYIDPSDTQLLDVSWAYRITPKYRVVLRPQWDFRADEFRQIDVRVTRYFPEFALTLQVRRDEIRDDTSFGASIGFVEF